jgi:hypothetical protein
MQEVNSPGGRSPVVILCVLVQRCGLRSLATAGSKEDMMEFVIGLLIGLVVFDLIALWWGIDSRDGIDSPEWERRQRWFGFH